MLDLKEVPENQRTDLAFQLVVAMRDIVNIAKKKGYRATYDNAIRLFHDFNPELYEDIITCLPQRNLSDEAKYYLAKAEAQSLNSDDPISALELVEEDIRMNKNLLSQEESSADAKRSIRGKISSLETLRKSLKPRKISENRILIRDTSKAERKDFGAKFVGETDDFVDYKLTKEKYLRIRLLHPDNPEHLTGADLIYEQHNIDSGKIRFLFLQYKIWEDGVLYFSKAKNLDAQLKKLGACICERGYCKPPEDISPTAAFRFPHCSAFLRPTDRIQQQNEKLVSSGIHIPVCLVEELKEIEGGKISKNNIRYQSLTHEMFEVLFNRAFIGSRWMDENEVEAFYKTYNILDNDESIIMYVREMKEDEELEESVELYR
ncbi:hypothetical protein [Phnomibacter sp. MR]|uniref:hypothetical protein n=1 Tax=Phnomibacter sp. MR TaxID=3042318 RepID=UPI003A80FBFC